MRPPMCTPGGGQSGAADVGPLPVVASSPVGTASPPRSQARPEGHLPSWVVEFIEEQSGLRGWVMGLFARLVEMFED